MFVPSVRSSIIFFPFLILFHPSVNDLWIIGWGLFENYKQWWNSFFYKPGFHVTRHLKMCSTMKMRWRLFAIRTLVEPSQTTTRKKWKIFWKIWNLTRNLNISKIFILKILGNVSFHIMGLLVTSVSKYLVIFEPICDTRSQKNMK